MASVVLVTGKSAPTLSPSDQLYADALGACGLAVAAAPWNGAGDAFSAADLIVLRANWDYHATPDAFAAWLRRLQAQGKYVLNAPDLVLWNMDKRYLLDLAARGVRVPETRIVPNNRAALLRALDEGGWAQAVIKPSVGASGHAVALVQRDAVAAGREPPLTGQQASVMVQEYLPELMQQGEISCVFFDGTFSHAALKRPVAGEFRVNSQYGGTASSVSLDPATIAQARAVLATLDTMPLYARVDGVMRDNAFILLELEVNEPSLALNLVPGAAARFADATVRRLNGGIPIR